MGTERFLQFILPMTGVRALVAHFVFERVGIRDCKGQWHSWVCCVPWA